MQNENNVNAASSASVAPTMPVTPVAPAEDKKDKMSKKQIIGLVVMSVIAVGGVLFGIYGMNSQNEQIAELTAKVTDADGRVAELETDKITITDPDGSVTEITDSAETTAVNPEDYIYIGEWGIKIKIPEELTITGYKYSSFYDAYGGNISISGVKSGVDPKPDFADIEKMAGGYITRIENGGEFPYGQLVYTDANNNNYYYQNPQFVFSDNEADQALEIESVKIFGSFLTNPENYSSI